MKLHKIKLPQDLDRIREISLASFQYPENPEWSIQEDEKTEISDMVDKIKRFWPALALFRLLSPSFRDILMGFLCEEDGKTVATTMYQRRSAGDFYITNVSVLLGYRRRGIARRLVEAVVAEVRGRGGRKILLDVIDGNLPAYTLYQKLGFEHFTGNQHLDYNLRELPVELPLADGYELVDMGARDWRAEYELVQRITPQHVRQYDPVVEERYRPQAYDRVLELLMGVKFGRAALRVQANGGTAAFSTYRYRTRPGGSNHMHVRLDPAHAAAAPSLIHTLTRRVQQAAPNRTLEIILPIWQEQARQYAIETGFVPRYTYCTLGLVL